jgi:hypothetical protein
MNAHKSAVGEGLRGGGLGLLVVVLAVDHGGEVVAPVFVDVLPDVQHAAAGGVHEHAAAAAQELHLRHGNPERGQDHHVGALDFFVALGGLSGLGEDADAHGLDAPVHVGVVDDLTREEHPPVGKLLACLVRVLDGAVDAVAEAELAGQLQHERARARLVPQAFQPIDHRARVVLLEHGAHHGLQPETLLEIGLAHLSRISDAPDLAYPSPRPSHSRRPCSRDRGVKPK